MCLIFSAASFAWGAESAEFVTGAAFRKAIEQPLSATWDQVDFRTFVRGIEDARHISLLLDRRLDPTAPSIEASASGEALRDCLERLAAGSGAAATVVGNTIYLGPRRVAAKLQTLVALRFQELSDKGRSISAARRGALTRGTTFRWNDLDRPADLISRLGEQYSLAIEGGDQVPHDLWGGAELPEASAVEALSLVLAQFDLTFAWTDQARGIRIEPIPERVAIEKSYDPPSGMAAATALARWKEQIPELEARVERGKVVVAGTIELHSLLERIRRGGRVAEKTAAEGPKPIPLSHQRYTGTIENIPVTTVLKDLGSPAKGQLTFEYDRDEMKAAGIDFDKLVTLKLKNATIEELLKATFDPLGVSFEISGRTVRLKPAHK